MTWKAARAGEGALKSIMGHLLTILVPQGTDDPRKARAWGLDRLAWRSGQVPAGFGLKGGNRAEFSGPWHDGMETETPQQVKNRLFHLKDEKKAKKKGERERETRCH